MQKGFDKAHPVEYFGSATFKSVKFVNAGQWNLNYASLDHDPKWAVIFKDSSDEDGINRVERCFFGTTNNGAVAVVKSKVAVQQNVCHRVVQGCVGTYKSPETTVGYNLAVDTIHPAIYAYDNFNFEANIDDHHLPAAFVSDSSETVIRNNRASHATMPGFHYRGVACDTNTYGNTNNAARGCQFGFAYWHNPINSCEKIRWLDITHSRVAGAMLYPSTHATMGKYAEGSLKLEDSIIANSELTNIFSINDHGTGNDLNDEGYHQADVGFYFKNLVLYGQTDDFDCNLDWNHEYEEYENYYFEKSWEAKAHQTSFSASFVSVSGHGMYPGEKHMLGVSPFNSLRERTTYDSVEFHNVGGRQYVCDPTLPSYLIPATHGKKHHNDLVPTFTKKITKVNVDLDYLTYYEKPAAEFVNELFCIDMDCAAYNTILINDWDGSLIGDADSGRGAILPNPEYIWGVPDVPQDQNYERVPPIAKLDSNKNKITDMSTIMPNVGRVKNNACSFNDNMNAHICHGEDALKYQMVTISNHDFDVVFRRIGPLSVVFDKGTDGTVDMYNSPARDQGTEWGLASGFFKTTVPMGSTGEYFLANTPPQVMRIQMDGPQWDSKFREGKDQSNKFLMKFYNPIPQLLKVAKLPSHQGKGEEITKEPLTMADYKPTLDDLPGTYYHDREEQMLYLVLADNQDLYEVTVSDEIAMSFGIPPVPLEDFFADKLVENVANFFGISADKIKVVAVVSEQSRRRRNADDSTDPTPVGEVTSIQVTIMVDDEDESVAESVHEKNDKITEEASLGQTSKVNNLLADVSSEPIEVETVAVVTTPKTDEAKKAFAEKMDVLARSGSTSLEDIMKANVVPEINNMKLNQNDIEIDCRNGGLVNLAAIGVSFYDTNGDLASAGSANSPWVVDFELPADYQDSLNGTMVQTVINEGASFNDIVINCDNFRHASEVTVFTAVTKVSKPESADFSKNINFKVLPLELGQAEFIEENQIVDCSIGGNMSMYDIDLSFFDSLQNEVYIGTESNPWTLKLQFSNHDDQFSGDKEIVVSGDRPVSFSDLSVNCDSFKEGRKTYVTISVKVSNPKKVFNQVLEYNVVLTPEAGEAHDNNWQERINMINEDGTIRLIRDQNKCLTMQKGYYGYQVKNKAPMIFDCKVNLKGEVDPAQQWHYDPTTSQIKLLASIKPDSERKNKNDVEYCMTGQSKKWIKMVVCKSNDIAQQWYFDNGAIRSLNPAWWSWCIQVKPYLKSLDDDLPADKFNGKKTKQYRTIFNTCHPHSFGNVRDVAGLE